MRTIFTPSGAALALGSTHVRIVVLGLLFVFLPFGASLGSAITRVESDGKARSRSIVQSLKKGFGAKAGTEEAQGRNRAVSQILDDGLVLWLPHIAVALHDEYAVRPDGDRDKIRVEDAALLAGVFELLDQSRVRHGLVPGPVRVEYKTDRLTTILGYLPAGCFADTDPRLIPSHDGEVSFVIDGSRSRYDASLVIFFALARDAARSSELRN